MHTISEPSHRSRDRQFVEALSRGLAILEFLSKAGRPLTNGNLAELTGLAPSTVSRLTQTLRSLGYVQLSASSRAYQLTPKNLMLGYPVLARMQLIDQLRPHIEELSRSTGETIALAVRDNLHVAFVAVHEGSNPSAVRFATGGRMHIAVSAAGIAILSACEEAERRRLVSRVFSDIRRTGHSPEKFKLALDRSIDSGVTVVRNLWRMGHGAVSVPVRGQSEIASLVAPVSTRSVSEYAMSATLADGLREVAEQVVPTVTTARVGWDLH